LPSIKSMNITLRNYTWIKRNFLDFKILPELWKKPYTWPCYWIFKRKNKWVWKSTVFLEIAVIFLGKQSLQIHLYEKNVFDFSFTFIIAQSIKKIPLNDVWCFMCFYWLKYQQLQIKKILISPKRCGAFPCKTNAIKEYTYFIQEICGKFMDKKNWLNRCDFLLWTSLW
jgi:hypothetical protein